MAALEAALEKQRHQELKPLCGAALKVPPEGLSALLWGAFEGRSHGDLLKLTRSATSQLILRIVGGGVHEEPDDDGHMDGIAVNPGVLIETAECFPIAFISTKDLKDGICAVNRVDAEKTQFAEISSEPSSHWVRMVQDDIEIASMCVDMMGKVANIVGPGGELLATVTRYKEVVRRSADVNASNDQRCRMINFAPGVDAGMVTCLVLGCMQLKIGNI